MSDEYPIVTPGSRSDQGAGSGDIRAESVNLSQTTAAKIQAEMVRMQGGSVGQIIADEIEARQVSCGSLQARQIEFHGGMAGMLQGQHIELTQSPAVMARAEHLVVRDGSLGAVYTQSAQLDHTQVGLVVARQVQSGGALRTTVLLAGHVDGPVETLFNTSQALLAGLTSGVAVGLVLYVFGLLGKRKNR